jgi:predicted NBD/HSP70 family sugar kinase
MDHAQTPRIGIDLGGTKIEAVVMQSDGSISHRKRVSTPSGDYLATLHAIHDITHEIGLEADLPSRLPLGIGTPGAVSLKTGLMINCNSTCLNGQPLVNDLQTICGRAVRIANDADCFALSEASDGAAKDSELMVGVILGTGVGGGIIINQQLSYGVNAIRGEWGHNSLPVQVLQHDLPGVLTNHNHACFCGRTDCVETWISGPAFAKHFELLTGRFTRPEEIMQLYREGDTDAETLFQCQLHLTALALSNLINALDPDCIVLGGGLSNITEFYKELPKILPAYVFSDVLNTQILKAEHGDSSGVRGAAWLWQQQEVVEQLEQAT